MSCLTLGVLFLLFFSTIIGSSSAQEMFFLSFGSGKTEVRLYTDYFCGPCSNLEPKIEPLVADLVKRHIITITFVDTPFHTYSSLYAKYFLYILNEKKEIKCALKARAILFTGAKDNIFEQEKLEVFLGKQGLTFKAFDTQPVFSVLQNYLREDRITSTPTCVISNGKNKEVVGGTEDIVKALKKLK
jgi:thiol:disulfide interchange protein DsbA